MKKRGKSSTIGTDLKEVLVRLKSDSEALQDLILLMEGRLYKEAFFMLRDHTDAKAAVNWTFYKLWAKSDMYTEDRPSLPYVLSVIRNYCRDIWRAGSRKIKTLSLSDLPELYISPANYTEELVIDLALNKEEARIAKKICLDRRTISEIEESDSVSPDTSLKILVKLEEAISG